MNMEYVHTDMNIKTNGQIKYQHTSMHQHQTFVCAFILDLCLNNKLAPILHIHKKFKVIRSF